MSIQNLQFYPGGVLLIPGYKCSNNCSYCYLKKNGAKMEQNMDLPLFEKAIEWYDKYLSTPDLPYYPSIAIIGGEPLAYWDSLNFDINLPKLAEIAAKKNCRVRLVSNGVLMTEHQRELIKKADIDMDISLDGPQECHDKNRRTKENLPTWEKAYDSAKKLMEDGNDLRLRGTIAKNNAGNAFEMYKFLFDSNCRRFGIEVDSFTTWNDKQLQTLAIQYQKILEHYISNYDPKRSCFSLDRVLKVFAPDFIKSTSLDGKFLRANSVAILPDGEIKINHNFPVWADLETAKLFSIGSLSEGLNEETIKGYLEHFGLLTESSYYAENEKEICASCPANQIMCHNPHFDTKLPRSVWIPDHKIQCYALRFIALYGVKYLKKYGIL